MLILLLLSCEWFFFLRVRRPRRATRTDTLFPYTSRFRARVATLPGRRTVKKDAQAAWLLKAVTCIDLTPLAGDDTPERVKRLCAKAKSPVRPEDRNTTRLNSSH